MSWSTRFAGIGAVFISSVFSPWRPFCDPVLAHAPDDADRLAVRRSGIDDLAGGSA